MFTKHGTRAGRDLLLAHEHLLRVVSLVNRLGNEGDVPAPRKRRGTRRDLRSSSTPCSTAPAELTEHTAHLLEELGKD